MVRRAVLAGGSLNPFGGGQVDFGAFNVGASPAQTASDAQAAADRAAALQLNSQEIQWNAGQISNDQYLAALQAYAALQDNTTTSGQNAIARVATYEYRFQRDAIAAAVDGGQASIESLLAYDRSMLGGVDTGSEEYQQRLGYYQQDQSQLYNQRLQALNDQYQKGQLTSAQLNEAYVALGNDGLINDNRQIRQDMLGRISNLADAVQTELDNQTLSDYQRGRISPAQFIAYGAQARQRYVAGSSQYADWTSKLADATDQAKETGLLYRYGLTQDMINLEKFIQSSGAPKGGTSTSTRTVLQADGTWKTVKSTTATAPSASEVKAYAARQVEVAAAKTKLDQLQAKLLGVGGIVSTASMTLYYKNQLAKFAVGSDEWYQVQGKLDQLADTTAAEKLLASQGIRISYPKAAAATTTGAAAKPPAKGGVKAAVSTSAKGTDGGGTSDVALSDFMVAIARQESGGRYTAQNKSSGAYGKYQIMPANWAGWAKQYLGNANAAQTPENQEKVAAGKMQDLYKWLGDWRAVAAWWVAGGGKAAANPASWSAATTHYVDNVMAGVGKGPTSGSALAAKAASSGQSAVPSGGANQTVVKPTAKPAAGGGGVTASQPLRIITGVDQRSGEPQLQGVGLPTGLDGKAFDKFYSQYSAAFASGATEFSVNTGSGTVHYWVGDDAVERQNLMRQVDALQISKAREEMIAYSATDTAESKANAYDHAVEVGARHEYAILDMNTAPTDKNGKPMPYAAPGGTVVKDLERLAAPIIDPKTGQVTRNTANPLAQGLHVLEVANTAIADMVKLGDEAFAKGDLTKAYSFYQLADSRRRQADKDIIPFALGAQQGIAAIEQQYGVSASEAMDQAGYGTLSTDLARLTNYGPELDTAINAAAPNLTTILQVVRKDGNGQPRFDTEGPGGQLSLDPHFHFEVDPSGTVKIVKTAVSGVNPQTGDQMTKIPGMVNVDYLIGTKTINAFVKYQTTDSTKGTGGIGVIITASGQRIPLDGMFYTREKADGSGSETWYRDPFSGKWSNTPITYKAPPGFQAITVGGKPVYQFGGSPDPLPQGQTRSDYTYSLTFDAASGTYIASRSKPGSFMTAEVKDEEMGAVAPGTEIGDIFTSAGFTRDLTGLSGDQRMLANLNAPFVGGTAAQYSQWTNSGIMAALKPVSEYTAIQAEKALIRQHDLAASARTPSPTINAQTGFQTTATPVVNAQTGFNTGVQQVSAPAPLPTLTPIVPVVNAQTGFVTGSTPTTPVVNAQTGFVTGTTAAKPAAPKPTPAKPGATTANQQAAYYSPSGLASTKPAAKPVALPPLPVKKTAQELAREFG